MPVDAAPTTTSWLPHFSLQNMEKPSAHTNSLSHSHPAHAWRQEQIPACPLSLKDTSLTGRTHQYLHTRSLMCPCEVQFSVLAHYLWQASRLQILELLYKVCHYKPSLCLLRCKSTTTNHLLKVLRVSYSWMLTVGEITVPSSHGWGEEKA